MIVCGHTHIPRLVRLANGQTIVNPGSVGVAAYSDDAPVPHAMENYSPDASYAILEKTAGWDVTFRKVPYDTQRGCADGGGAGAQRLGVSDRYGAGSESLRHRDTGDARPLRPGVQAREVRMFFGRMIWPLVERRVFSMVRLRFGRRHNA